MDTHREKKLRREFCDILFELAKSQELFQDVHIRVSIYKRLENLYGATEQNESFRHFYSDIFSVLTQIQQDQSLGDINILGQNLDIIRNGVTIETSAMLDSFMACFGSKVLQKDVTSNVS